MITIGGYQHVCQSLGEIVLADERVSQQGPEHALPPALDGSGQRQLLVRLDVGNEAGEEWVNR